MSSGLSTLECEKLHAELANIVHALCLRECALQEAVDHLTTFWASIQACGRNDAKESRQHTEKLVAEHVELSSHLDSILAQARAMREMENATAKAEPESPSTTATHKSSNRGRSLPTKESPAKKATNKAVRPGVVMNEPSQASAPSKLSPIENVQANSRAHPVQQLVEQAHHLVQNTKTLASQVDLLHSRSIAIDPWFWCLRRQLQLRPGDTACVAPDARSLGSLDSELRSEYTEVLLVLDETMDKSQALLRSVAQPMPPETQEELLTLWYISNAVCSCVGLFV